MRWRLTSNTLINGACNEQRKGSSSKEAHFFLLQDQKWKQSVMLLQINLNLVNQTIKVPLRFWCNCVFFTCKHMKNELEQPGGWGGCYFICKLTVLLLTATMSLVFNEIWRRLPYFVLIFNISNIHSRWSVWNLFWYFSHLILLKILSTSSTIIFCIHAYHWILSLLI